MSIISMTFFVSVLSSFYVLKKSEWKLIKSMPGIAIRKVSIDPYNNIFVADDKGNLFKFDSLGNETHRYSPSRKADITLVEAWRAMNIFIFSRELQEYNILDRFLTTSTPNFKFKDETEDEEKNIGFARLATIASDNNLWVFDDENFSIKKYNTRLNEVMIHSPLDLILDAQSYDLTHMREYQNLLFISDRNSGVLVFDNLGNYKNKIDFKNIDNFNFLGDQIYFIADGKLILHNIYTGIAKQISFPSSKEYRSVLLTDNKGYFFTGTEMEVYSYKK
ncbi:MAG: hypothetical protein K2X86_11100 [Cytophagaceae bacterium]|nr:hypothetical protein [Cytophagaceae bacterium]